MPRPAFRVKMIVFNSENIHAAILIFEYSGLILNNIHINISKFNLAKLLQFFLFSRNIVQPRATGAPCSLLCDGQRGREPLLFMSCYYCFINISKQEYSLEI